MNELTAIRERLRRLQWSYRLRRGGLVLLTTAAGFLALWTLFVVGDLALQLPDAACWIAWFAAFTGVCAGIVLFGKRVSGKISDSGMAVLVEHAMPGIRNRLVNAVQLGERLKDSPQFLEQILQEENLPLDAVRPRDLLPARAFTYLTAALSGTAVIVLFCFVASPAGTIRSTARLFAPMAGVAPYTRTQILTVEPKDASVLRGDSLDIAIAISGDVPEHAYVQWDRGERHHHRKPLMPAETEDVRPGIRRLDASLESIFYPSRYRVVAGDARSQWFSISVIAPPGLLEWEAHVIPPSYVQRESFRLDKTAELLEIPVGSKVEVRGRASAPLSHVQVVQGSTVLAQTASAGRATFAAAFTIGGNGRVHLKLAGDSGLESEETLPFVILLDQPPRVSIVAPERHVSAGMDSQVPVRFEAEDDYGITASGLERILHNGSVETVSRRTYSDVRRRVSGGVVINLAQVDARPGQALQFRVWAEDNAPLERRQRGHSNIVTVRIPEDREARQESETAVEQAKSVIAELIRLQRDNLRTTRSLAELAPAAADFPYRQVRTVQAVQTTIRQQAAALLDKPDALGDLRNSLSALIDGEMAQVITVLGEAQRLTGEKLVAALERSVRLEARILAVLTGMPQWLDAETRHQQTVDLMAQLQRLTARQKETLRATRQAQDGAAPAHGIDQLARTQDRLANDLIRFTDQCWVVMEGEHEGELQMRVRDVYDLIQDDRVYEKMLTASEALDFNDLPAAIQTQQEVVRTLLAALDIMNRWRMENAREKVSQAMETLRDVADRLEEMERRQAQIAEVTRELRNRGEFIDDVRDLLGEMDREQDEMADMIEQLAQDLYQFPELPVSNELNSKMFEIYEAVEQAANSENEPAIEIAVQKEDAFLDAIRATRERVEDIEMWLPDAPDTIAWNKESFDTDEFPDIPLVPLPDELEDIVGDLLEQAEHIDAMAQDATGNNIVADGEMGWDIMDGPIPSFSAKGKSGNTRPNENEMTGRSGAGREGQSVGELVENHVKGLEGRETQARRTDDPFQHGSVTEDEDSTMKARGTGGGKLGGESESEGMFGQAPRRDLHVPDHALAASALRRETEALYATARLLYLGTGSLGAAAAEMRQLEHEKRDMENFATLHQRVVRRLQQSQIEIGNDVVLPMPVASVSAETGGAAIQDVDVSRISAEYRDIISEYYRSLDSD